ncbi:RNase H domain-containing protein [Trichonephila clavipes]|uniref:RNase H domain-containing protein n=1 Tax=Trichonephila clavipes TaxID=2585209 RepID=A0A8X6UST7_TRICX|nr:RNase H domain-containing protein [Trichonephila clavipes]
MFQILLWYPWKGKKEYVPLRTAYSQAGRCGMQPKAKHSLRAQAQLMRTETVETFELVKVEPKLLEERKKKENERVHFHFDLSTSVVKRDLIPDHFRLSALKIINRIPSDTVKIYTDGSRLSNRAVGDKAGVSILQKLTQISESHDVHFQWIPSHINIFGNEQADILTKEGWNASPPISSTLAYSEHQSRIRSEILKEWRTLPNHH